MSVVCGSVAHEEMNGKRPAEPGPGQTGKKRKKEVTAEFSDAVTEEILKKQVAEAWSHRTPLRHGKAGAVQGESPRGVRGPRSPGALLQPTRKGAAPEARGPPPTLLPGLPPPFLPGSVWI